MNPIAHIFITYILVDIFLPNSREYFIPIALFSVILDLDHIPGWIKIFTRQQKKPLETKDFVKLFRSAIQEPIGVIVIEAVLLLFYLYGVRNVILYIAVAGVFLHWLIDFLTVHTKPFAPLNDGILIFFFDTRKERAYSEIIITLISGLGFVLVYFYM